MRQYTADEIQAQFEKLPRQVQEAVASTDVNDKIEAIGKKNGLMIDQIGELIDEVGQVMMGLQKPALFVDDLCERLAISRDVATKISEEVNTDIFALIRHHLIYNESSQDSTLSSIGGIEIGKTDDRNAYTEPVENIENRPELMASIENPEPAPKVYMPSDKIGTDPLINHLLTTPVVIPPQKINKPTGPDPYREPTK